VGRLRSRREILAVLIKGQDGTVVGRSGIAVSGVSSHPRVHVRQHYYRNQREWGRRGEYGVAVVDDGGVGHDLMGEARVWRVGMRDDVDCSVYYIYCCGPVPKLLLQNEARK
jgi:hypothetical protein